MYEENVERFNKEYEAYEGEEEAAYFNGGYGCEEDSDCWSPMQCLNGECVRYYCTVTNHCPKVLPVCHVVEYSYGGWGYCGNCANDSNCENGETCNYLNMCEEEYADDEVLIQQKATLKSKTQLKSQTKSKSKSKSKSTRNHHHHSEEELLPLKGDPTNYARTYGSQFARASTPAQAMMMSRITPALVAQAQ